jgi:polar amino acid transport system substrate-binding protein
MSEQTENEMDQVPAGTEVESAATPEQTEGEPEQVPADTEAESTETPEAAADEDTGMSTTAKIVIVALAAIALLAICGIAAILLFAPPGEAEPTATTVAMDDSWERVQAAGRIVVGTSADYPPFEFYIGETQIDGFDIALMDEIGRRLGIQVEYLDFAFDGLGNALQLGQIDAAIAAISITADRESVVDFSNVYLVTEDGVLEHQDSSISIGSTDDLANLRVGVQRGSVYEDWLHAELVETGKMPEGNLLVYERAGDAVRDLREGRVELVVMDLQPAEAAVAAGGVKLAAQGLNQQRLALAYPKGAQALKAEIDRELMDLFNEGFVAQLAKQYLDMDELLPTPTPAVTSTPGPPPDCVDGLTFVEDLTQEGEMLPGQAFTKGWRVMNSGTCTWDTTYNVVLASGDAMGGQPTAVAQLVAPGETYDIQLSLVSPLEPGAYEGMWQMVNAQGQAFGVHLKVAITVSAGPTVTPAPTETPAAGIVFTVDRNQIMAGECVNFYWKVENVQEVYFYAEGEDWQDNGVVGEGTQMECPPVTWTYYLRVVKTDGTVETPSITIYVESAADAPVIQRFTVDPPSQITLGQCVNIQWQVEGEVDTVTLTANEVVLWDPAPSSGSLEDCPGALGAMAYGITAVGPGGTSQGSQTIYVVDAATATPEPTAEPELPVITAFTVRPEQILAGESVGLRWSVSGGATSSRILRAEGTDPDTAVWEVVDDNAGFIGQAIDLLDTAGSYIYRLEASNATGDSVYEDRFVTVTAAQ